MSIYGYHIPTNVLVALLIIFSVLVTCTIAFGILNKVKKSKLSTELLTRVISWWWIAGGVAVIVAAPKVFGTVIIAYISFVALREMFSIGIFRESDRTAMFFAYFAIPIQFYLAYNNYYAQFLYFIPLYMFIGVPFILVLTGQTEKIGRSMSVIPTILIQTVYLLSHLVLFYNIEIEGYESGPGGLLIFLLMITAFNDVFQFTWGKLFGRHKILPKVSPNKTVEGFLGGVISSAGLGYFMYFLTPLEPWQALVTGVILSIMGFIGDAIVSAIKRDLGIKDTGNIVPGHGGALDRLDSILITTPIFYHLLIAYLSF